MSELSFRGKERVAPLSVAQNALEQIECIDLWSVNRLYLYPIVSRAQRDKLNIFAHRKTPPPADPRLITAANQEAMENEVGGNTNAFAKRVIKEFGHSRYKDGEFHIYTPGSCCGFFYKKHHLSVEKRIFEIAEAVKAQKNPDSKKYASCEMQACVAYANIKSICAENNIPLEMVAMIKHDHFFIILGRNPETDIGNPAGWNKEAVVLDPFAYACYPAREITRNMLFLINRWDSGAHPTPETVASDFHVYHRDNSDVRGEKQCEAAAATPDSFSLV